MNTSCATQCFAKSGLEKAIQKYEGLYTHIGVCIDALFRAQCFQHTCILLARILFRQALPLEIYVAAPPLCVDRSVHASLKGAEESTILHL